MTRVTEAGADLATEDAQRVVAAARAAADALSVAVNVAVLDASADLKAFLRMDGALLGCVDLAIGKAKTAALFRMSSEDVFEFCRPGGTSFGLENSNGGLVVFAGGRLLVDATGGVLGAVGVSGGSVAQDAEIARAAAESLLPTSV